MTQIVTYTNLEKESDVVIILRRQMLKNTHFKMPENVLSFLYVRLWREKGDFSGVCQLLVCQPVVLLLLMDMLLPMMRKRLSGIAKRCFRVSGKAFFLFQLFLSFCFAIVRALSFGRRQK